MPAGTVLLAGIASPPDRSGTAIELYRSNDDGFTWTWVSEVAVGGGEWGSANPTPIWEPYLLVANNRLIVYYSDERDKANHDQKIVHQTSVDGVTWGPVVEDVAMADRALRPGMPVVTRMANGQYLMVFEMFGQADTPYGSGDVRVNTTNGTGAWTPVRTTMPRGYSRMLQYVRGTGRVLILSVEGFWVGGRNSVYYGDVDLGHSAGPYYKLVNRASGKVLDVNQANLTDGGQIVQWTDNGGRNQHWQASTSDGARVVQWTDTGALDQQWQLIPVS